MHKLLDYLNNRRFDINTVEGAKEVSEHFLSELPDRLAHTRQVVRNMETIIKQLNIEEDKADFFIKVVHLHDIGYSKDLFFSGFHPLDAFQYLNANDWDSDICWMVLAHSFSRELASTVVPEAYHLYLDIDKKVDFTDLAIFTCADFTASPKGEYIALSDRVADIFKRYGNDSPISKHADLVKRLLIHVNYQKGLKLQHFLGLHV